MRERGVGLAARRHELLGLGGLRTVYTTAANLEGETSHEE